MGFGADVSACIGNNVYFVSLLDSRKRGADDADAGPQTRQDKPLVSFSCDGFISGFVLPGIYGSSIEIPGGSLWIDGFDLRKDRAGKGLFSDGGNDSGHFKY